jgi:hypothetical protein
MEPIDWSKPIELMDRTPARVAVLDERVVINWKHFQISTDLGGCIGGVQVVRNRKPVKRARYLYIAADGEVSLFPDNEQMDNCARLNIWRDEDGKTRVEVRDD